ncbi:MAG: hypothetical protein AAGH89_00345 [Verrucomicrobiota bacterium]
MTISQDTGSAISAIADGVDPALLKSIEYPDAVGAIINQHGWNLLWAGLVTTVGAFFVWRGNTSAIFVSALVGGFLDIGYFVFIDLGGYNKFVPGTIMTIICSFAIIFSFYAYFSQTKER